MPQNRAPNPIADTDRVEALAEEAIAACGGDVRQALKTMIVANEDLEAEAKCLRAGATSADTRPSTEGPEQVPRDRKDWYD
jgi:hypothetical protein